MRLIGLLLIGCSAASLWFHQSAHTLGSHGLYIQVLHREELFLHSLQDMNPEKNVDVIPRGDATLFFVPTKKISVNLTSGTVRSVIWAVGPEVLTQTPPNVMGVFVKIRTETQLTLEWNKVNNFSYILRYSNGTETPVTVSAYGSVLRYTVSSLSPGTKYTFLLYAVFKGVKHNTFNFTAVTSPSNVASVSVKARSETAITFEWTKVNNNNAYIYILKQSNRSEAYTPMYWGGSIATHTVSSLSPGTKYTFTLYTVFGGVRSSGYNFSAATMPVNVARVDVTQQSADHLQLSWDEVKSSNISYILRHSSKAETTIAALENGSVVTHTVSSLSPGTRYNFTLYTVFEGVRSRGLIFTSVTASQTVTGLRCEHLPGGNALVLVWDAPSGQWSGVEVQMKGRNPQYLNGTRLEFHDLHPALWYNVTLKLCAGDIKSTPVSISCQTDPRGVIAGVVLVLLFMVLLVCLGVLNHRQSVLNRKTQPDLHTNQASIQGAEEGVAKQQLSKCKNHPGQRLNKKKRVNPIPENPYSTPCTHLPTTSEESSNMMEQIRN